MVIAQEDADGRRTLNEAVQVFPEGSGRHDVQLGWPHTEIRYRPGSRHPERAVVHLTDPSRKPLELGVEILNSSPSPSAPATRPPVTGSTAPGRAVAGATAASTTSPTPRPIRWPPSG